MLSAACAISSLLSRQAKLWHKHELQSVILGLQGMLYRCRKCRRLLATQNNVVPVTEGPGSIAFKYRCEYRS